MKRLTISAPMAAKQPGQDGAQLPLRLRRAGPVLRYLPLSGSGLLALGRGLTSTTWVMILPSRITQYLSCQALPWRCPRNCFQCIRVVSLPFISHEVEVMLFIASEFPLPVRTAKNFAGIGLAIQHIRGFALRYTTEPFWPATTPAGTITTVLSA